MNIPINKLFVTVFLLIGIVVFYWRFGRAAFFSKEKFKEFIQPNINSVKKFRPDFEWDYTSARMTYLVIFIGGSFISLVLLFLIYIMWS